MKKYSTAITIILALSWIAYPPNVSQGQEDSVRKQPVFRLMDSIKLDMSDISKDNLQIVDSFMQKSTEIRAQADSILELSTQICATGDTAGYTIGTYHPPLTVLRIPFKNKIILARYNEEKQYFEEIEIILR